MEDEVEFKEGKRKITPKKVFPGYVLVEMDMDDQSWYVVRNTSGVTGFVGSPGAGEKPVPLQDKEVKTILKQMGIETPKLKIDFKKGDRVKVTSGPFFDFTGLIDEIQPEKEKVRALISIFGRETPVELEFYQIEKCNETVRRNRFDQSQRPGPRQSVLHGQLRLGLHGRRTDGGQPLGERLSQRRRPHEHSTL